MESIVEEAGKGIWAALRFLFWYLLFDIVLLNIGRAILLAGTLGRFPRSHHFPRYQNHVAWVGIAALIAAWCGLVLFNRTFGG